MKAMSRRVLPLLLFVLLIVPQTPIAAQEIAVPGQALKPLDDLLQTDGTLDLHAGFNGSLDPRGWRMVSEPGQPPRFLRSHSLGEDMSGPVNPAVAPGDEFWDDRFNVLGVNGYVSAVAVSENNVYVGGRFNTVGGLFVRNIAKWDSATGAWSALGEGIFGNDVYAIAVSGNNVYVGGSFNAAGGPLASANNIAKWDGNGWSPLGVGVNGAVYALAVSGSDLYVGGEGGITKWNSLTTSWSAVGSSRIGKVYALAASASGIYVGGDFDVALPGDVTAKDIAKWNGSAWSALGSGVTAGPPPGPAPDSIYVRAIAVSGNDVYVGGNFTLAGGVSANRIAKWNGSSWSALGSGVGEPPPEAIHVRAIAVSGSDVYVAGRFGTAGGVSASHIAKWNGSSWSALGSGVGGDVNALAIGADGVYVGGLFSRTGGKFSRSFGLWHGTISNPPNPNDIYWDSRFGPNTLGVGGTVVRAVAVSGSDVYVGGGFTTAGGVSALNIAKWNGSAWSALGTGTNGGVTAIAVSGSDVYVGGGFTTAGGVSLNHVAKWNGSTWAALGSGTNGTVYALAVNGSDLYVGGLFGTAGGVSANNIARWNGSTWSPLGSGVGNPGVSVDAIAVGTVGVYVGGNFITAGGKPSNRFGLWYAPMITPPSGGISGRVTDPGSNPVPGAPVQVCPATGGLCLWRGVTDSQGIYQATSLPNGQYQVTAYPPSSSYLLHSTIGPLTIANGANLIGKDIQLQAAQILPPDVSITPSTVDSSGVIHVRWKTALQLTTQGCTSGSAGYQIIQNGAVLRSGTMAEGPAGQYIATIAQLYPNHDYVTFRITIQCPGGATQTTAFTVYIDPSGIVRTIGGTPIMSATVTLYTFDDVAGDFIAVPNGDAIMSPANRANPDTTDAEGRFGWDVTAGFYKVRAEKAGCVSPNDFTQPYVETDILTVPPAVTDLDLRLGCGERLFLPLVMR